MMELTSEQIEFINNDIRSKGITIDSLAESLLDHICCVIENDDVNDFHLAYENAIKAFGLEGLIKIEEETIILINLKKEIIMKKTMYSLGYAAAMLITTGLLFKLQHWAGASVILTLGIILLNFAFLPMYFYDRYRQAVSR